MAESIEMCPIEEVYDGVSRYECNGVEFLLCPVTGNSEDENERYYSKGQGVTEKTFVLPAVKVGTTPNDDKFYPVSILYCCNYNGRFMINTFKNCCDDEKVVFFDAQNKRLLDCYKDIGQSSILAETQEHIVGSATKDNYFIHHFWNFDSECFATR